MPELAGIFLNVLAPVFLLAIAGYVAGPRLKLEARTLSRVSYYLLMPCFVFDVLAHSRIAPDLGVRMSTYAIAVHLAAALLAWTVARLLRCSPKMTAALILLTIFGNVGNFGPPIIQFRFPGEPLVLDIATIYFLAIMSISFIVGVLVANWHSRGLVSAVRRVIQTPALLAVPPALLANTMLPLVPPVVSRTTALLGAAMIPVMLVALGVQLAGIGIPRLNRDMLVAGALRLIATPLIGVAMAVPFGVSGLERSIGIIQSAMPSAVLASIIAYENDLLPEFVTATVLFSTLASVVTLTIVLALV